MARAKSGKPVDWATVANVTLPELQVASHEDLVAGGQADGMEWSAVEWGDLRADGAVLLECRFVGGVIGEGRLRRARLSSCLLQDLHATTLDLAEASLTDVRLQDDRIGALLAHGVALASVTFEHVRLDYVNLRGAKVRRTQFVDCRIGELDLDSAELTQVRFERCEVDRLIVHGCLLSDVDLRGVELGAVDGVGGLAGGLISDEQLARLAPALAEHLQISVAPVVTGSQESMPSRSPS